jgi:hypothetical protein
LYFILVEFGKMLLLRHLLVDIRLERRGALSDIEDAE